MRDLDQGIKDGIKYRVTSVHTRSGHPNGSAIYFYKDGQFLSVYYTKSTKIDFLRNKALNLISKIVGN